MRLLAVSIGVAALLVLAGSALNLNSAAAQPSRCLHGLDETPAEKLRRQQALGFTRHINNLQADAFRQSRVYPSHSELRVTESIPADFVVSLTSDGTSYAFSVKDALDPCRFGYFSDQTGAIHYGQALGTR
jgi:hypothetical protein